MSVRKNILASWSAHLVTILIGLFLMPYILGTVGEAQYGAWLFINAIAGYSAMIYSGFGATICRFVADLSSRKDWKRLNAVVSSIQSVYYGTAVLVLIVTAVIAWWAPALESWEELSISEVQTSIMIVGSTIGLGMIASVYGGILVGTQRLDLYRGIEVGSGILRLILTVVCLHENYGLITLSLIFLVVTIIEHLLCAIFAYRQIPTLSVAPWHVRKDALKECFGFSAFNAIALAAEYVIFFTDTIIIGVILGPRAVVPYQIGLRIAQMIRVPVIQIGEAILPKAGELYATQGEHQLGRLVAKGMGLAFLLTAGFTIGSAYFGDELIRIWMRQSFESSHLVLVILMASQAIGLPMMVMRKALIGIGQVRFQALIDIGEAILNLGLSLILIRWWGIVGVAWGTLIPLVLVEFFLLFPVAARQLKVTRELLWEEVLTRQTVALVALVAFCEIAKRFIPVEGWISLIAVTAGGGATLLGTWWLIRNWSPGKASNSAASPPSQLEALS